MCVDLIESIGAKDTYFKVGKGDCVRPRQLFFGACALHSSQSAAGAVGKTARRLAVEWAWDYLGRNKNGLIDAGAVMEEFKTPIRYEAFVRRG